MAQVDEPNDRPDDDNYAAAELEEIAEGVRTNLTTMRAAVQWHLSGASWHSIAQRFFFSSPQAARVAVEKFEGDMVDSSDVAAARNKARARYERLLQAEWADATSPFKLDDKGHPTKERNDAHQQAMINARGLIGDLTRLDGLNAPSQLQLYVPGAEELMAVVSKLRDAEMGEIAREPDIWEAEVVEDDGEAAAS